MIVEGYSMDLYCDCPNCTKGNRAQVTEQFAGIDRISVTRQAKNAGWYLTAEDTRNIAYAPGHWPDDKLLNRKKVEQRKKLKAKRLAEVHKAMEEHRKRMP